VVERSPSPVTLVAPVELRAWAASVLRAAETPPGTAVRVADSLIESELRGYASHGVLRLPGYVAAIRDGLVDPAATPEVVDGGRGAVVVVDGRDAFGQVTAGVLADELTTRATESGVAFGVTRRCRHVGRLGEYVEHLSARGFIGFATVSAEPLVAAHAGGRRILGTNPHAWGFPAGRDEPPVVIDFATSVASAGRVFAAEARGERVPGGWLVDSAGESTSDPAALRAGGALLPFGAHKGLALSLVADMLAGVLSGTGSGSDPAASGAHGLAMLAIDVSAFGPAETFRDEVEALRRRVAASSDRDAALPGEGSASRRRTALRDGIGIPAATMHELRGLARALGTDEPPGSSPRGAQ